VHVHVHIHIHHIHQFGRLSETKHAQWQNACTRVQPPCSLCTRKSQKAIRLSYIYIYISAVYTSNMQRAVQTASILSQQGECFYFLFYLTYYVHLQLADSQHPLTSTARYSEKWPLQRCSPFFFQMFCKVALQRLLIVSWQWDWLVNSKLTMGLTFVCCFACWAPDSGAFACMYVCMYTYVCIYVLRPN